jgi:hypothetical protein
MKAFDAEKGKIDTSNFMGPSPIVKPIVTPRLMRAVPSNIAKVIGNFDETESA